MLLSCKTALAWQHSSSCHHVTRVPAGPEFGQLLVMEGFGKAAAALSHQHCCLGFHLLHLQPAAVTEWAAELLLKHLLSRPGASRSASAAVTVQLTSAALLTAKVVV